MKGGPKLSSCASVFAKMGNPWVSQREGVSDFNRKPEYEDPSLDQFTKATKATPHFEMGPQRRKAPRELSEHDILVRKAYAMNQKLRKTPF